MTLGKLNNRTIGDRLAWIDRMISEIKALPLENYELFISESRNIWAAESCLRRALEALFDLGRHILAKSYGRGVSEYKEIAVELEKLKLLSPGEAQLLRVLAGYRNRLVHFYHEVTIEELYSLCKDDLEDVDRMKKCFLNWIKAHPELIDKTL